MKAKSHKQHFRKWRRPVRRNLASRPAWAMILCGLCVWKTLGVAVWSAGTRFPLARHYCVILSCRIWRWSYCLRREQDHLTRGTVLPKYWMPRFRTAPLHIPLWICATQIYGKYAQMNFDLLVAEREHGLKIMLTIRCNGFVWVPW